MRDGRLTLDARVLCLTLDGPGTGRLEWKLEDWKKQTNQNTDHDWIFRHESSVISHHATIVYKGGLVIMYPIINIIMFTSYNTDFEALKEYICSMDILSVP